MRMRAVVAGGAGFLGSHLCRRLVAEGISVVSVDNLITGTLANTNIPGVDFLDADVSEPFDFPDPVHMVFNLASPASPPDYLAAPIATLRAGSLGTMHLLDLARDKGAAFLQASTSEVYGDPLVHPQREDYWGNVNPIGPRSCYDEAKRFGEAAVMAYHRQYGLNTRMVRIFNTYGPGMRVSDGRALPNFLDQAMRGVPMTIYGDGSQTRSLCYVDDLIDGIWRMVAYNDTYHLPVNLGSEDEITVLDLAKLVKRLLDSRSAIEFQEAVIDDPRERKPDTDLAFALIKWRASTPLEVGILASYVAAKIPQWQAEDAEAPL